MADQQYAMEEVTIDFVPSSPTDKAPPPALATADEAEVAAAAKGKEEDGVLRSADSYEDAVNKIDNDDVSGEKEKKKKKDRPGLLDIVKVFRFATPLDILLMLIGTIMSMAHGAALPVALLYFGGIITSFTHQLSSVLFAGNITNGVVNCSDDFLIDGLNMSFKDAVNAVYMSDVCLDNDEFFDEVVQQIYAFIGTAIGTFLASYFQVFFFQLACERQVQKIRLTYYKAVLRQDVGWFDANPQGEISSRLSEDLEKIHSGIGDKLSFFIEWTSTFLAGFIIAFVEEWRLTLLLTAFAPLLALSASLFSKVGTAFTSEEQKQYADAGAVAEEVLSSVRTVVAFGGEEKELNRYDHCLKKAKRIGAKKGFFEGLNFGFIYFIVFSLYSVAFWFGGWLISKGFTDSGDVLTVFFVVLIAAFSIGQASPNLGDLVTAAGSLTEISKTIKRIPPIDSSSNEGLVPEKYENTIELKDVSFSYPTRPELQVLTDVSFKVESGQTVALVGASGCGKSTVVQLLERFYDVTGGTVFIGGNDIRTLNLKWLRKEIGVVSQEPVLFDTTIAENIRYGFTEATMDDIERAAKKANAHSFISQFPKGYDTYVGERGVQMSGGQKQRIAIARALVRDPKILLLDEATSALDTESERVVQEALDSARQGRTTIIVAHRLSTIKNADMIISIEDGEVVEQGTHAELMDKKGLYYELAKAQLSGGNVDEITVTQAAIPGRILRAMSSRSRGSQRKRRGRSKSESSNDAEAPEEIEQQVSFDRQVSFKRQDSSPTKEKGERPMQIQRQVSEKQQEEWDKELKDVSLFRVLSTNAKEWWLIIIGLISAFINGVIYPAFAILFGNVFDVFALPPGEVLGELHLFAGLFLLVAFVAGLAIFLKSICFTVAGERLTARLRYLSFKAMLRQEIGWFDNEKNSTGALTTRLSTDASQVHGATGVRLGTLLETFVGLFASLVIAFAYSWLLTIVILGFIPILVIAGILQFKTLTGHATGHKKSLETAGKVAVDSVTNIRTVAGLGVEELFYERYHTLANAPYRRALFNTPAYGITYGFSQGVLYFGFVIGFLFGAFQVTRDPGSIIYATFEEIFIVFIALIFGAMSIGQAGSFAPNYAKAKLSANRVYSFLDVVPSIDSYSEDGKKIDDFTGDITFEDVKFRYPTRPNIEVLKGLKFSIGSGKTLALVGPSGCGKSTVVSLLERFYDSLGGEITLDKEAITALNIKWMRSQFGIVSQEPVLFDCSIAENIRYGANHREVSDDEVIGAAKAANIHSFIETLPKGYSTNVGARGTQLSGGQKQRIAIARALVRDPKILLLDEATSALDMESERVVQEALDRAQEGRTSIVIAHRLSTIKGADCIAVIDEGVVVESGTHQELMEQKGLYHKLNQCHVLQDDSVVVEDMP